MMLLALLMLFKCLPTLFSLYRCFEYLSLYRSLALALTLSPLRLRTDVQMAVWCRAPNML